MNSLESPLYHGPCEYCEGTVGEKIVPREIFSYLRGFVILEHVPVGVCNHCHARYYLLDGDAPRGGSRRSAA